MFADGKTTVEGLFHYFRKFTDNHPEDLRINSPFYAPKGIELPVKIQGEESTVQFTTLDRMIGYLLYDDTYLTSYRLLRWNNTGDSPSTYQRNIKPIKENADNFRQELQKQGIDISSLPLTDAAKKILALNKLGNSDVKFWKKVLNIMSGTAASAPTAPRPPESAESIISEAIKTSTKKCLVFTGAPGTGKTYCVEKYVESQEQMKNFDRKEYFVQFHSSYDYTDFVEGLRPIKISGEMEFERMDGIFKAFCRKVVKLGGKGPYYFVIDEINRADLGRVFGELMYCFEKRGQKIATQYANLDTYDKDGKPLKDENGKPTRDGCFDGGFYIPDNVIIIGTMNDIDRSVETFDFALRRRFDWVEIDANKVMESSLRSMKEKKFITGEVTEELVERIKAMNEVIAHGPGLSPAFAIGPSYFSGYDGTEKKLQDIWKHNIEPILKEYMRGRQGADKFIGNCKAALFPNG